MCDLQWEPLAAICLKKYEWSEEAGCICSRLFTNTKGKKKKRATEKNISLVNETENGEDTTICAKTESDSGADLSEQPYLEAEWHKFWSQNGEGLIWDSWIEKYSAYIKPEYLQAQSASVDVEDTDFPKDNIENSSQKNQALKADSKKSTFTNSEIEPIKALTQLNLNSSNEEACVSGESEDCKIEESLSAEMSAMGLPSAFSSSSEKRKDSETKKKLNNIPARSDSFNAGRNKIRAALNLIGMEYKDDISPMTGRVDYKMKHIRLQNRHLQIYEMKPAKHTFFDDDGNVVAVETNPVQENICLSESEDSDLSSQDEEAVTDKASDSVVEIQKTEEQAVPRKKKKKMKVNLPPEILENTSLKKYWRRRFDLFSRFDEGIRLDKESWYSVTPEQMAKFTAEKCKCDIIIDACCGAGGNTIQFAMTCKKVISMDIDPLKIEMAKHNASIYGVADKIEFIVGDFLKLAPNLKADVLFLSPPWGGPDYINKPLYDLETMLLPVPLSDLMVVARKITSNIALFLPKNSNTQQLIDQAGPGGRVELQQEFLNKKLIAITAFYGNLVKSD